MYRWQRERYPDDWEERAFTCKDLANWRCEQCGVADGSWRMGSTRLYQVKLNAAHLDHDPKNPNPRLKALCQDCHLKHDALENGRKARSTHYRKVYDAMRDAGQLELFEEQRA